jgi:hypothetical protein
LTTVKPGAARQQPEWLIQVTNKPAEGATEVDSITSTFAGTAVLPMWHCLRSNQDSYGLSMWMILSKLDVKWNVCVTPVNCRKQVTSRKQVTMERRLKE